jgi:hypothetical protein
MVVTVPIVRVMKVAVNQIIHMIPVRDAFVPATGPMLMCRLMPGTLVVGRAALGIGCSDVKHMLVDMFAMHVVHMSVVEVIDMAIMNDSGMPALGAMRM